jgi:acyl-CoA thioesterase-1
LNPIVFHIVSGDAFFSGAAMLLAVVCYRWFYRNETAGSAKVRLPLLIMFLAGMSGVVFSSTPMPLWLAVLLTGVTLAWCGTQCYGASRCFRAHRAVTLLMVVTWSLAVAMEIPWRLLPVTATAPVNALTVIGDSVSAGMEEGEAETWPSLLSQQHRVKVQDLSHVGETAGSALKRVRLQEIHHDWIIVEIGGNDILGATSASEFEIDLEALLSELRRENRQVVMFELPLIPLYHRYGMIQRRLATRYQVALIPKRYFLSILADSDSTLDSIHLSQSGHQKMSDLAWQLSRPR